MSTYMAKQEDVERSWYLVDAAGQRLGRLVSEITPYLIGKNKPIYTPHVDVGDFVIVVNAREVDLSGKKWEQKIYRHHSQFPGGMKEVPYEKLRKENPELIIKSAIKGMLPKNKLGRKMIKRAKIYADAEHPHQAQQPQPLDI